MIGSHGDVAMMVLAEKNTMLQRQNVRLFKLKIMPWKYAFLLNLRNGGKSLPDDIYTIHYKRMSANPTHTHTRNTFGFCSRDYEQEIDEKLPKQNYECAKNGQKSMKWRKETEPCTDEIWKIKG